MRNVQNHSEDMPHETEPYDHGALLIRTELDLTPQFDHPMDIVHAVGIAVDLSWCFGLFFPFYRSFFKRLIYLKHCFISLTCIESQSSVPIPLFCWPQSDSW